ncbi:uncharacterized protein LOC132304051 isoform X2 [Cornus florida]|uniref:uncharacterized protein LOC132304051 isoform X2 n=1 Tax=Cornus florida TaxID=4283 RepID=UPI00289D29B3|nr:uncharacterized protein LOC132304051 isoform X2 [Cornus florida]
MNIRSSMASARPLTTASRLFSTSLHQQSPHAAKSFSTRHCPTMDGYTKNPFGVAIDNIDGPRGPRRGDSVVKVRVDLPGMISEGLKLWVDENRNIGFEGKIKSEPKYEYEGGSYHGVIPLRPMMSKMCKVDEFEAELTHGSLWLTLPLSEKPKAVRKVQLDSMKKGLVKY